MTKTKIALVAALIAGTSSAAFAQGFDPNPANRGYPAYAQPGGMAQSYNGLDGVQQRSLQSIPVAQHHGTLQSAPVGLYQGRRAAPVFQSAPVALPGYIQQDEVGVDLRDRESAPFAGGVN